MDNKYMKDGQLFILGDSGEEKRWRRYSGKLYAVKKKNLSGNSDLTTRGRTFTSL